MKNKTIQALLIVSMCSVLPITYAAEPDDINLSSIELYGGKAALQNQHHRNKTDDVTILQEGNFNQATVDVNGKNNQVGLVQLGDRNRGDIQLDGDRNRIGASQVGNNLGFDLKVEGNNQNYILTQKRR